MEKSTIGALETGAYHPVYRRADGTTWLKTSSTHQMPAKRSGGDWVAGGHMQAIDPDEEVVVLHKADEEVA